MEHCVQFCIVIDFSIMFKFTTLTRALREWWMEIWSASKDRKLQLSFKVSVQPRRNTSSLKIQASLGCHSVVFIPNVVSCFHLMSQFPH